MNHKFLTAVATLLLTLSTITGCSDDTDPYGSTSQDCMVSAVSLGTLYRTIHTKDSKGNNSTYTVTVRGAYYPMSIDQINNRIFNADSLPYGTDISRVVFSTFSATGVLGIKALVTGKDSIFTYTDTTNFDTPEPREISVYTSDLLRHRSYTIELRVHQQDGEEWNWQNFGQVNPLHGLTKLRTLVENDSIYVWGYNGYSQSVLAKAATNNLQSWQSATTSHEIATGGIYAIDGRFFSLAGGKVVTSANGEIWTETGCTEQFDHLVAAGTKNLFAIRNTQLYSSTDGITWTASPAHNTDKLPANAYAGLRLDIRTDSIENVILLAANEEATNVWKKDIDLTTKNPYVFDWVYYPLSQDAYPCPTMEDLQITYYDDRILLTGTKDGAISPVYVSADKGRTWRTSGDYTLPQDNGGGKEVSIASCSKNFLYVVYPETGDVWRGRINRLGWNTAQGIE